MAEREASLLVLIVAPLGQDAPAMAELLNSEGVATRVCAGLEECAALIEPATGAVLLTEEALEVPALASLIQALGAQPEWSEVPVIVLTRGGEARRATLLGLTAAAPGTVTILERPMQTATLLHTVHVALRSRRRQLLMRDLLEAQQRHARERAERAVELERALAQRTIEVTQAQQRTATAERMAAVGTLAAGLAHDIKNLTMPLALRLQMVMSESAQKIDGESMRDLRAVASLVDHLRQMANNLSLFARDPEQEGLVGATHLGRWWMDVQDLLRSSIDDKGGPAPGCGPGSGPQAAIQLHGEVPGDLPAAKISPHRLTQAVFNLVHNARDAICSRRQADPQWTEPGRIRVQARAHPDGQTILLQVSDNGIGMTDEVRRRSIEPFFTTRGRPAAAGEPGGAAPGSGMGLWLVHGTIVKIRGSLEIQSEPGQGTTITLGLPRADAEAAPASGPAAAPPTQTRRRSEDAVSPSPR